MAKKTLKKTHKQDAHEELKRLTVMLEEDQIESLKALVVEYREKLGQRWTLSAMVRVAVGDFLTRMGRIS
ncbi:MAG: hypothetical protein HZB82_07645 [Deltaproteobacteria bacterium]|nr:hypothetical protein [Deltaproteobacteria bacterium]